MSGIGNIGGRVVRMGRCIAGAWVEMPAPVVLGLMALFSWVAPAGAQLPGVRIVATETRAQEIVVRMALKMPQLEAVVADDGNRYTRVALEGCGADNDVGHPAMPLIAHTIEIPRGMQAVVTVETPEVAEIRTPFDVLPHQPPRPKTREGAEQPFVKEPSAYSGDKAAAFQKSKEGVPEVRQFRRRGRDYVNVLIRPYEYRAGDKTLRYPLALTLRITGTPEELPKAAGPRPGLVLVVQIEIDDRSELDVLNAQGYNIANVQGRTLTIYATAEEVEALRTAGYVPVEIERQPRPRGPQPADGTLLKGLGSYHSYAQLTATLTNYAALYPQIARLESVGTSVEGRDLWVMTLAENPDAVGDRSQVKYVSTMHGNEPLGLEMSLYLIDHLLTGWPGDGRVSNLLANTVISIMPCMNPDGLEAGTRFNAGGFDLNRSFPDGSDAYIGNILQGPPMQTGKRPPEVARVMEWSATNRFVLSANFHTGALVVNYPYDNDGLGSVESPSPDDDLFRSISLTYASNNPPMSASTTFPSGIVNGAAWYSVSGGMQDWNYRYLGCNEVTIELSDTFRPPEALLPQYWEDNRESMLAYLERVHTGVRGVVSQAAGGDPVFASVQAEGIDSPVFTASDSGRYHRMFLPGTYHLVFSAPGYQPRVVSNVTVSAGNVTRVDATLEPSPVSPGNYIVLVSRDEMRTGALAFKSQKEFEGFVVHEVVMTGDPTAKQVRSLVREVYDTVGADYVIILGDVEQIPTFYSGGRASDLLYGLMDAGEGFADYLGRDLLVGRVPLESDAALLQYVQKLNAFVAASKAKKHGNMTWISNGYNSGEYDISEGTHEWVIENATPADYTHTRFYRDQGSAAALSAHIDAGTDAITYSGHGGSYTWVRYDYGISQVEALQNHLDAPIVISHACDTGMFALNRCFGESWMEATGRGIVFVGGSDSTYWGPDDVMQRREYAAMIETEGMTIAQAIDAGLLEVHNQHPGGGAGESEYYYTIYNILGDPTVTMFGLGHLRMTTASELTTAFTGRPYSLTLQAAGGEPPYTWSLMSGEAPDGLTLDVDTGELHGVPLSVGTHEITVVVTDSLAASVTNVFSLRVVDELLIVTPPALFDAVAGSAYTAAMVAVGGSGDLLWSSSAVGEYVEAGVGGAWSGNGSPLVPEGLYFRRSWPFPLPWPFPFYGQGGAKKSFTTVWIASNGYIDFEGEGSDPLNSESGLASSVRIAPLWDDLGMFQVYATSTAERVEIRWRGGVVNGKTPVDFEAILHRDGDIEFRYGIAHTNLTPTIGLSAGDGVAYTLSSLNGAGTIQAGVSLLFEHRADGLPAGLFLDAQTGVIAGETTTPGLYLVPVRCEDAGPPSQTATREFVLRIWDDSDGDGLPDWWEDLYFGGPTNARPDAMAANGVNSVFETYVAGLNPLDVDSRFEVLTFEAETTGQDMVLQWASVSNRFYRLSSSTNLPGIFLPDARFIPATPPVNEYRLPARGSACSFFRVEVEGP